MSGAANAASQNCLYSMADDWIINETSVCDGENILLNGNLLINASGNLTLQNSVISFNSSYSGEFGIDVNGSLTIADSTLQNESAYPYTFVSNVGASLVISNSFIHGCGYSAADNKKMGVYVKSSGSNIANTIFSGNYYALLVYSAGNSISGNAISANYAGLKMDGSGNVISRNAFSDNSGGNLVAITGNNILFEHNTLLNSALVQLTTFFMNNSLVNNNTFINNTCEGFAFIGANNNITNNRFEATKGSYGLEVVNSDNTRITGNTIIQNNGYGLYLLSTRNTLLENNLVNMSSVYDLFLSSASATTISNTNYTYSARMWKLGIRVLDNAGSAVSGALVNVRSNLTGQVYSGTTNSQGGVSSQTLNERIENASGVFLFNPYSVNVTKAGYYGNYTEFNLTSDLSPVITLVPVPAPPQNFTFTFTIDSPRNATYLKYNLTVNGTLLLAVSSAGNISACSYSFGNITGQLGRVSANIFSGYLNVSNMDGGKDILFTCISNESVTNSSAASFVIHPSYECVQPSDCEDTQVCIAWKCEELECTCGRAENHDCVEYECCSDSDCKDSETCNMNSHACAAVDCACPEKISGHKCNINTGYCCSDFQCDGNETCASHECVERTLSLLMPSSLEVGGKFSVKVIDQNSDPVEGVKIDVKYLDTDPFVADMYETDADGSAVIEIKHAGRVDVVARKGGYFTGDSLATVPEPFNIILVVEIIVLIAACGGIAFTAMRLLKNRKGGGKGGISMSGVGGGKISLGFSKGPLKLEKTVSGTRVMLRIRNTTGKKMLDITVRDSVPRGAFIRCNLPPKIEPFDETTETLTWEILELGPKEEVDIEYETRAANKGFAVKYNEKEYSG